MVVSDQMALKYLDNLSQCVTVKDAEGRVVYVNRAFAELEGKQPESFIGKTDADLYPAELAAKYRADDVKVMEADARFEVVEEHQPADGERMFVRVVKLPTHDDTGRVNGIQVIFWDVTEEHKAKESLRETQKELIDTAHRAGMAEIATEILHQAGNVLNSVNVSCELILSQMNTTKASKALGQVAKMFEEHREGLADFIQHDERGHRLSELCVRLCKELLKAHDSVAHEARDLQNYVETIKDVIRTQQNYAKTGLRIEELNLELCIEDVLNLQSVALMRDKIQVERVYGQIPVIRGQRIKILHILVNLINNAREAMEEIAECQNLLRIETGTASGKIFVRVIDNGPGIPTADMERIFNHGYSTKPDGYGFGLHTCANFMTEMGGEIRAGNCDEHHGAVITLIFPTPQS